MNAKCTVMIAMLLATLAWTTTPALAQDAKDAPAAAPATEGFEAAGTPAGDIPATPAAPDAPAAAGDAKDAPKDKPAEEPAAPAQEEQSPLSKYFPFLMIGGFLLLWMFMGRSRKKQEAKRKAMLSSLSKGDRVVTIGGIVGTIVETRETEIVVKVDDNTRLKFARWAVRNAGQDAEDDKKKDTQEQQ